MQNCYDAQTLPLVVSLLLKQMKGKKFTIPNNESHLYFLQLALTEILQIQQMDRL